MKYTATIALLALLVAACDATTETTTTANGSTSTTSSSLPTTTSVPDSTTEGPTTTGGSDTTERPSPTVPLVIAQVGFDFASGDDPTVLVRVSVAESRDGPWLPAGDSDSPTLSGPSYWVRFDITNTDGLGAVLTDLDISGFEAPLGDDVCELDAPLPQDAETTCIVGGASGFSVQSGFNEVGFSVNGIGPRQGEPNRWYAPQIPSSLEFNGARNSFVLVFDTTDGVRVDGASDPSEIEVDVDGFELSGSVRLDCTGGSPFDGEPGLEAYVIENFSAGGDKVGGCSEIPSQELDFSPDDNNDSDEFFSYFGAETTTIPGTTTTSG